MSVRASIASPSICSGAMYWKVPMIVPSSVRFRFSVRVVREFGGKDFDRYAAIEPRVARLPHLTHAAGAERREDFVRSEAGALLDQCCTAAFQFVTSVTGVVSLRSDSATSSREPSRRMS